MAKKKIRMSNVSVGMGGTLIITIFVALCLTIFATLSFSTAHSDLKLAKKTEEITYDYYVIHGKAEEKLSEIYDISELAKSSIVTIPRDNVSKSKLFLEFVEDNIENVAGVSLIERNIENDILTVYYETLGNKNQKICVTLNISYDAPRNEPHYEIKSWNLTNIKLPAYEDENFKLWEGIE